MRLGARLESWRGSLMPFSLSDAPLIAEMAMGISWTFVSRRVAVTTMSDRPEFWALLSSLDVCASATWEQLRSKVVVISLRIMVFPLRSMLSSREQAYRSRSANLALKCGMTLAYILIMLSNMTFTEMCSDTLL